MSRLLVVNLIIVYHTSIVFNRKLKSTIYNQIEVLDMAVFCVIF